MRHQEDLKLERLQVGLEGGALIKEIKDYAKDIRDRAKLVSKYSAGDDVAGLSDSEIS